ncbi:MAG: LOG family protein [Opitutales bacterium]|nr:LOG family protein [Opitutales bacterium]
MPSNPPSALYNASGEVPFAQIAAEHNQCKQRWEEHHIHHTIAFLGSSRLTETDDQGGKGMHWYQSARYLAHQLALWAQTLPESIRPYMITGGGSGIMEAVNRGASEAGAMSIGLVKQFPSDPNLINAYCTRDVSMIFHSLSLRKFWLLVKARALVFFPGGFGTLDELFNVCALIQTNDLPPLPIILFGSDFWNRAISWDALLEQHCISAHERSLIRLMDDADAVVDYLKTALIPVLKNE